MLTSVGNFRPIHNCLWVYLKEIAESSHAQQKQPPSVCVYADCAPHAGCIMQSWKCDLVVALRLYGAPNEAAGISALTPTNRRASRKVAQKCERLLRKIREISCVLRVAALSLSRRARCEWNMTAAALFAFSPHDTYVCIISHRRRRSLAWNNFKRRRCQNFAGNWKRWGFSEKRAVFPRRM
jgi:hypothetical protein